VIFRNKEKSYQIDRYPHSSNNSLQPWSAADEHILRFTEQEELKEKTIIIYNDRFGFLTCLFHQYNPVTVISNKSHELASLQNMKANRMESASTEFINPLSEIKVSTDLAIIKIPKSTELFRLYLHQLSLSIKSDAIVICSFMTRHFSPQILEIASRFYSEVKQGKAWKKSRLLILKKPLAYKKLNLTKQILFKGQEFRQYFGVFSSKHIDYASQFLIEHINAGPKTKRVLDLASGNGILACAVRKHNKSCEIHLTDDCYLAVESSKMNIKKENTFFYNICDLSEFENDFFDYIISNPPFHFEYEINIETPLQMFSDVLRCLSYGGRFQLVANRHLNYKPHLVKLFSEVNISAENRKYIIYECKK
jgi:23S rRNA (guanine1835-N2)-methyltransferase